MKKENNELLHRFLKIASKGYVKGVNNNTNSIGLTFENLIGKTADSKFLPDYKDVEIKCTSRFSRYPISLFSYAFDGKNEYEMNRLLLKYGKKDVDFAERYQLQGSLYCKKMTKINDNYFKLDVKTDESKIFLSVYDLEKNLIESEAYIDIDNLKERIKVKLSNLCIVHASKKKIDNDLHFRYYKIAFYELINLDTFINLIKNDNLNIFICGRVSRSGSEMGIQKNKNIVFKIPKDNISLLFEKTYEYNFTN